jgi:hypothetical protein
MGRAPGSERITVHGVAVAITAGLVAAARGAGAVEHGRGGVTATVLVGDGADCPAGCHGRVWTMMW